MWRQRIFNEKIFESDSTKKNKGYTLEVAISCNKTLMRVKLAIWIKLNYSYTKEAKGCWTERSMGIVNDV